jgi:PAS domain S-box-containing protein
VLFGYTSQEMIGQSIRIIVPLDYQNEESYILEQIHQGKTMENFKNYQRYYRTAENATRTPTNGRGVNTK